MCKVYTGYHDTSEIEHVCVPTKARGLSLRTGAQTMLYLSLTIQAFANGFLNITTLFDC